MAGPETRPTWGQSEDTPLIFHRSDLDQIPDPDLDPSRAHDARTREGPQPEGGEIWLDRLVECLKIVDGMATKYFMSQGRHVDQVDQDPDPAEPMGTGIDLKPVTNGPPAPPETSRAHDAPARAAVAGIVLSPNAPKQIYDKVLDLVGSLDPDAKVSDLVELMISMEPEILAQIEDGLKVQP